MTISAPPTYRQYKRPQPINSAASDYTTPNGVRLSAPIYIDVPTAMRKDLLTRIRDISNEFTGSENQPATASGISVVNSSTRLPDVEAYIGMTLDNLRNALFTRGGLSVDLLLKLQSVTGVDIITDKDITALFKHRAGLVKTFIKDFQFDAV